jgi:hypothetical protein
MKGRYFLMPMLDGWTNVFQVPGKRTTGTKAQKYLISGPGWAGTVPDGVTQYKSETNMVWIIGRTYCTGTPQDYAAVHALQDQYKLVPLSAYGKPYTPPLGNVDPSIDEKTPVRDQVNNLDISAYFNLLAKLMKGQSADGGRRADGRQNGKDRARSGAALRRQQTWAGCRQRTAVRT